MVTFEKIIKDKRLIDISLFQDQSVTYTGVCLKINKHIWILVNYDFDRKAYNGFSIFKNEIIETFTLWKKSGISLKYDNLKDFTGKLPLSKMETLYSSLKNLSGFELVAVIIGTNTHAYYIGKVLKLNKNELTLKLIDKSGKWLKSKKFPLSIISFISFGTDIEDALINVNAAV